MLEKFLNDLAQKFAELVMAKLRPEVEAMTQSACEAIEYTSSSALKSLEDVNISIDEDSIAESISEKVKEELDNISASLRFN